MRRISVRGQYGVGKVEMVYKPRKRRPILIQLGGILAYVLFASIMILSFSWSKTSWKNDYAIPVLKSLVSRVNQLKRIAFSSASQVNLEYSDRISEAENITTIKANSLREGVYLQGQVHAKNHIYQLEIYRYMVQGKLSLLLGQKAEYMDRFTRKMKFYSRAQLTLKTNTDFIIHDLLSTYTDGVNVILSNTSRWSLPLDFSFFSTNYTFIPWQPVDSLAILHYFTYLWSYGQWEEDVRDSLLTRMMGEDRARLLLTLQPQDQDDGEVAEVHGKEQGKGEEKVNFEEYLSSTSESIMAMQQQGSSSSSSSSFFSTKHQMQMKYQGYWHSMRMEFQQPQKHHRLDSDLLTGVSLPGLPFLWHGQSSRISNSRSSSFTWTIDRTVKRKSDKMEGQSASSRISYLSRINEHSREQAMIDQGHMVDVMDLISPMLQSIAFNQEVRHILVPKNMLYDEYDLDGQGDTGGSPSIQLLEMVRLLNAAPSSSSSSGSLSGIVDELKQLMQIRSRSLWRILYAMHDGQRDGDQMGSGGVHHQVGVIQAEANEKMKDRQHDQLVKEENVCSQEDGREITCAGSEHDVSNVKIVLTARTPSDLQRLHNQVASAITVARKHKRDLSEILKTAAQANNTTYSTAQRSFHLALVQLLQDQIEGVADHIKQRRGQQQAKHSKHYTTLLPILTSFDGSSYDDRHSASSIASTIIELFRMQFLTQLLQPLGIMAQAYNGHNLTAIHRSIQQPLRDKPLQYLLAAEHQWWIDQGGGLEKLLLQALDTSIDWLEQNLGKNPIRDWTWQQAHKLMIYHPIAPMNAIMNSIWNAGPVAMAAAPLHAACDRNILSYDIYPTDQWLYCQDNIATSFQMTTMMTSSDSSKVDDEVQIQVFQAT